MKGVAATFPIVMWLAAVWRNLGRDRDWIALAGSVLAALALGILFLERGFLDTLFNGSEPSAGFGVRLWISALAACLLVAVKTLLPDRLQPRRRQVLTAATLVAILAYVTVCLAFIRLRSPDTLFGDMHFEAVYYSISQIMAGKTVFADLPSQYGLYGEIIAPLLWLTGYDVATIVVVFSVLQYLSYIALIATVFLCIKSNLLRLLCCFSMLFFDAVFC